MEPVSWSKMTLSHTYCYYFNDDLKLTEWQWSERYPGQKEILKYLRISVLTSSTCDEISGSISGSIRPFGMRQQNAGRWEPTLDHV